jgi:hypothetical protein
VQTSLARDIRVRQARSRFQRSGANVFALRAWGLPGHQPEHRRAERDGAVAARTQGASFSPLGSVYTVPSRRRPRTLRLASLRVVEPIANRNGRTHPHQTTAETNAREPNDTLTTGETGSSGRRVDVPPASELLPRGTRQGGHLPSTRADGIGASRSLGAT